MHGFIDRFQSPPCLQMSPEAGESLAQSDKQQIFNMSNIYVYDPCHSCEPTKQYVGSLPYTIRILNLYDNLFVCVHTPKPPQTVRFENSRSHMC